MNGMARCGMGQVTEESGSQAQSECRCAEGVLVCDPKI